MKELLNVLLYLWQLPQNIVGAILTLFYKTEKTLEYREKTIRVNSDFPGGISLGDYIFVYKYPYDTPSWRFTKHEYGHSLQSLILGPFYLLVIGLPSLIWAWVYKYDSNDPLKYYKFYTEKWADKLGGVVRE